MKEVPLSDYVHATKAVLGDRHMSDRALGARLPGEDGKGYRTSAISDARYGYMSDPLAVDIGEVLKKHGLIEHPGEVLLVARAYREKNERVKATLLSYAKKVVASASKKAVSSMALTAVTLGLFTPLHEVGGEGELRPA